MSTIIMIVILAVTSLMLSSYNVSDNGANDNNEKYKVHMIPSK